jgi:hypothetical protein
MPYSTINSRTVLIPELRTRFNLTSTEPPSELSTLNASEPSSQGTDLVLESQCQKVFGVSWADVMTFSKWTAITNKLLKIFESQEFKSQMTQAYGGTNREDRDKTEKWVEGSRTFLLRVSNQFSSAGAFAEAVICNGMLNPSYRPEVPSLGSLLDYMGDPTILQSVFWDLLEQDVFETELRNWSVTSALLSRPATPSVKWAFGQIQEYEFPVAGSPGLKPIRWDVFRSSLNGAALVTVGYATQAVGGAIGRGDIHQCLVCAAGGAASALIFISVGWVGEFIERYLLSTSERKEPSPVASKIRNKTKEGR